MTTRMILIIAACIAIVSCGSDVEEPKPKPLRVLFVGNSLTYVGNLPAVFDALSGANGLATASDMLVTPGGSLTDRVGDGSMAPALASQKYSYVVLQERGGDFMCGFDPEVCVNARASLATLVRFARDHGSVPILLGTYQEQAEASQSIEAAESLAAFEAGLDYISISERLQELRSTRPDMTWFASDGEHPGPDLTLLYAVRLFERIHGVNPSPSAFEVSAPMYTAMPSLKPIVRPAAAPAEELDAPSNVRYESERIATVLESFK